MSKPTHTHCPSRHNTGILEILLGAALLCFCGVAFSQEKADLDAANRIRDAALNHSQIMEMVGYLTDVTGPRLTGSPNLKKAEEYARDRLGQWGLANAHLEAWGPFGCGWSLEGFTANMLSPAFSPLIAYPKAWSPSTNGTIRGEVVFLDVKTTADLDSYKDKLKGKIVLFSPARNVDPLFDPPAHRQTDEELLGLANAEPSADPPPFQFTAEQGAVEELNYRKWQLIQSEGAAWYYSPRFAMQERFTSPLLRFRIRPMCPLKNACKPGTLASLWLYRRQSSRPSNTTASSASLRAGSPSDWK